MRIHCLQHVPFENEAGITEWATANGHATTRTLLFDNQPPPDPDSLDMLLVMGGPMNIYEHDKHPWLVPEKTFIRQCIDAGKKTLGFCLGAQLISDVLGGEVTRNPDKEIGWLPVTLTPEGTSHPAFATWSKNLTVFQWHGDTFSIPPGAVRLAQSTACANQAFAYKNHVIGMQFHVETTPKAMAALIEHCADDITPGPYVQSPQTMQAGAHNCETMRPGLHALLDAIAQE